MSSSPDSPAAPSTGASAHADETSHTFEESGSESDDDLLTPEGINATLAAVGGPGPVGMFVRKPTVIKLDSLKTLAEAYSTGALRASPEDAIYEPSRDLLERVSLFQGDITKLQVDSIVNAANRSLLGGGGVDGAIHSAAGPKLLDECRTLNGCQTGQSKITRAYDLPSNYIIHTVGPIYSKDDKDEKEALLRSCYQTCLELAVANSLTEIAFCSISTGIYGYPIDDATHVALDVTRKFLESGQGNIVIRRVIFVVWSDKDKGVYETLLPRYFPLAEKARSESATPPEEVSTPSAP